MSAVCLLMTIFESILVVHALFCSLFLVYLVFNSSSLHFYSRIYLMIVGVSMVLFSSYGLSIFEYLNAGRTFAIPASIATFRSKTWEFIHEFGLCLQSLSLFLFSIERYMAIRHPKLYSSPCFLCIVYFSITISIFLSVCFSVAIHVYEQLIPPTLLMSISDYLGLIVLVTAWRSSIKTYRNSMGVESLGRRYQMSEVYAWSSTLLPAIAGASISRVIAMLPIWVWLLLNLTEWEYGIANFLYNNILNAYVVIFPWLLIARSKSLKKQILTKKQHKVIPTDVVTEKCVKTLEGKNISMRPSQNEVFDALQVSWNL